MEMNYEIKSRKKNKVVEFSKKLDWWKIIQIAGLIILVLLCIYIKMHVHELVTHPCILCEEAYQNMNCFTFCSRV